MAELYKGGYWAAQSKTDWNYRESVVKKNAEEQQESLKTSSRLKRPI